MSRLVGSASKGPWRSRWASRKLVVYLLLSQLPPLLSLPPRPTNSLFLQDCYSFPAGWGRRSGLLLPPRPHGQGLFLPFVRTPIICLPGSVRRASCFSPLVYLRSFSKLGSVCEVPTSLRAGALVVSGFYTSFLVFACYEGTRILPSSKGFQLRMTLCIEGGRGQKGR